MSSHRALSLDSAGGAGERHTVWIFTRSGASDAEPELVSAKRAKYDKGGCGEPLLPPKKTRPPKTKAKKTQRKGERMLRELESHNAWPRGHNVTDVARAQSG